MTIAMKALEFKNRGKMTQHHQQSGTLFFRQKQPFSVT